MNTSRPDKGEIFNAAVELSDAAARTNYVKQACGDDVALKAEIEELLKHDAAADSLLDRSAADMGPTVDLPVSERPGTTIGSYKLLQRIGEGGFGVVYMAEQTTPVRRKLAVKIVKPGMDSKEVVARFEAERQALALMDHPNVAKVLDAGTTEGGRPFFAMELVHGVPITEFCDDQKLTTRERLDLFIDVCRAVQHAHQKGIIHRDLKPSNVMVTLHDDHAVPKVIDFGVSKALSQQLTERTLFTAYGQMVGTPMYMSPEQAQMSGLDVDTRSDLYSLGVLLYELLTGTTPFDRETLKKAGFDEMRRIIREDEPPRPSARISTLGEPALSTISDRRQIDSRKLRGSLQGELDWIVMKALEKDRSRRYETASALASDIRRYLEDETIEACPPSRAYRFRRFTRRHKAVLASALMVVAALLFGMAGTAWQAVRANAERDIARQHSRQVTFLLASSHADRAQALCEQGEIGRGMLWYAEGLRTAPPGAVDLQDAIRANLAAWDGRLHQLTTIVQTEGTFRRMIFSPDGAQIITASYDGTVDFWNPVSGEPIGEPLQQTGRVINLAVSPDGQRIVTGGRDGTAQVWDVTTRKPIGAPLQHTLEEASMTNQRIGIVAFSPDGSQIVTGTDWGRTGTVRLWDAETREPLGELFQQGGPAAARYCPGGLRILVRFWNENSGGWQFQLWDVDAGEPVGPAVDSRKGNVAVAISPDGSLFATAAGGGRIMLWRAEAGELAAEPIVHGGVIWGLTFSPDGSLLLSGGNTRASMVWDTATGRPVGTPLRQQSTALSTAFSPEGTRMATGSQDGSVRIWTVSRDQSAGGTVQHDDRVAGAGYNRDGLRILTERDGSFQIRDATTGEPLGKPFSQPGAARNAAAFNADRLLFSPDASRVLIIESTGNRPCCLRNVATGQILGEPFPPSLSAAAFSPDGSRLFTGHGDRPPHRHEGILWDALTLEPIGEPVQHAAGVLCAAFSPDGARLLTGCIDGTLHIHNAATLEPIGETIVHQSEVKTIACHPDGVRILIGFADGTARLWDLNTREPVGIVLHHQNIVSSVAFSPAGSQFLTCSLDSTARLWDTATQKPIGPPRTHAAWWPQGSFRPDGGEILLVGKQGTAQLWPALPAPIEDDPQQIQVWTRVITGLTLNEDDGIASLGSADWREQFQQLKQLRADRAQTTTDD